MNERLASVGYVEERGEWLAVIFRMIDGDIHVLTVGCEDSEEDARKWAVGTIQLMNDTDNDEVELPDKHDRARVQ